MLLIIIFFKFCFHSYCSGVLGGSQLFMGCKQNQYTYVYYYFLLLLHMAMLTTSKSFNHGIAFEHMEY